MCFPSDNKPLRDFVLSHYSGSMATFNLVFPCKKLRRSTRLEIREKIETKERTIQDEPLGYFEIIPLELKFLVFTYLPGRLMNLF